MSTIQHDVVAERTDTIVRSIASGNNSCGTLIGPGGQLNENFLRGSITPTLKVYQDEADALRANMMRLSQESEERRQTLEFIYSNALGQLPKQVADRLCQVLGFRPAT
ncbi:MAG: hypothetical protein LUC93_06525 [Planctomycetaceae bacterium]|nr:hypothetical protein [Planctomycetaceae bacterium]